VWLTDKSISKSFICHQCIVLFTVYVFYARTAPVRSQHVAPRCTLRNSRPRFLLRLPLPIPTPLKLWMLARRLPVLVFVLAAVAVAAVVDPRLYGLRKSADRMADCTQKLQATIRAAVESWQTGFNSLIVQRVRFFSWADGCSTRCDLFNLVPHCPVSRCPPLQYGTALSGLAMWDLAISAPPAKKTIRISLSRTQFKKWTTGNNVYIVSVLSKVTVTSCSFKSNVQCVRLAAVRCILKCVVTQVVSFSIDAFKTLTFHKVV